MQPIIAEVRGQIPAPLETVFDVFAPIDLTTIMTGFGPMPAVVAVEEQTGDWSSVGESRILRLADGSAMLETLTGFDRPFGFAYVITELTSGLRHLISSFRGTWSFELIDGTGPDPVVHAQWRYEFAPRSILTRPMARWIVNRYWHPYMHQALALASDQALVAARGDRDGGGHAG
jgi:hypothetical protein